MIQNVELMISGMTCAACSARIEKRIAKLDGVDNVSVHLVLETANINYDSNTVQVHQIIDTIEKLGYGAFIPSDTSDERNEQRSAQKKNKVKELLIRWVLAFLFAIPLLWPMMFVGPHWINDPLLQFFFASVVQWGIGWPFYRSAFYALRSRSANMDVLVVIGTTSAYGYSIWSTFWMAKMSNDHAMYFETAAVLMAFIVFGKWLEASAKGRTSEAIEALMYMQPQTAFVRTAQFPNFIERAVKFIYPSQHVLVKAGARIPVDGFVIEGESSVDESMMSGESIPVDKLTGSFVYTGTINLSGPIVVEAVHVGNQTALAQMIHMVDQSQREKAPIQRIADRVSAIFVPIVLLIALVTFVASIIWFGTVYWSDALNHAISVLVIACPCALGLATPTALVVGTGQAAKQGIFFRNVEALEIASQIRTVIFDKTGTLTTGKMMVRALDFEPNIDQLWLISAIVLLESRSEHPIAKAIVEHFGKMADTANLQLQSGSFSTIVGQGISGIIDGQTIMLSNKPIQSTQAAELRKLGMPIVTISLNDKVVGWIACEDRMKDDANATILKLKSMGIVSVILSGDHEYSVNYVARELEISEWYAAIGPLDKFKIVEQLKNRDGYVAMVGDGMNDAVALQSATVSMAIGTGANLAMSIADLTLMRGHLISVLDALHWSKKTVRTIRQNLAWAFVFNLIGIPAAAFGFLEPWIAGAAMALSSITVIGNSLLLKIK